MTQTSNERELISGSADTLFLNTFRLRSVRLTLTDKRVIIGRMFSTDAYLLEEIVSVSRFKAMFMNIGIRFHFRDGTSISLATRHIKKFVAQLQQLGKM